MLQELAKIRINGAFARVLYEGTTMAVLLIELRGVPSPGLEVKLTAGAESWSGQTAADADLVPTGIAAVLAADGGPGGVTAELHKLG